MLNLFLAAETNITTYIILGVVLVAVVVMLIVMPWLNNKKSKKKYQSLLDAVSVGTTVKTIGGVVGKVVAVNTLSPTMKEFVLLTGTGDNKTEMTFDINALYQVIDENTHEPIPMEPIAPVASEKAAKVEEVVAEEPFESDEKVVEASDVEPVEVAEVVEASNKTTKKK